MGENGNQTTCMACGQDFAPPAGATRFFCPHCGTPMSAPPATDAAQAAQRVQQRTQQAADLALDAVQQAVDLAGVAGQEDDARAALEAAQQAMEAVRIAQGAQQAMEEAQRAAAQASEAARIAQEMQERAAQEAEQARQQAAEQARREEEARRKAEEEARREQERRQAEQTERERAERERRVARQRAQAAGQARAQKAQPQRQPPSSGSSSARNAPPTYKQGVVRSTTSGHGLFSVTLPSTWGVDSAVLQQGGMGSRAYGARVSFSGDSGVHMSLELGESGTRNSAGMDALMATYGRALAGADRTNYAPMPKPRVVADNYARTVLGLQKGADLECLREYGGFDLARRQQEARDSFTRAAQASGPALLKDPFACELVRIYRTRRGNALCKVAVYVRIYAIKDASGVDMMNPVGLAMGLGSAVGSLFGKRRSSGGGVRGAEDVETNSTAQSEDKPICVPALADYLSGGTIFWDVSGLASLVAPEPDFERAYYEAFLPLVGTFEVHDDVLNLTYADARQQAAAMQQATNVERQRMNMQTQATMAAARQVQAAADARFDAWQRQSDAHHAAFRERTNSEFYGTGAGGGAGDFAEAMRGVNTFVTSDGRVVEMDVQADRAYENQAGDVIGGSGGFDPGADWTEIPRA